MEAGGAIWAVEQRAAGGDRELRLSGHLVFRDAARLRDELRGALGGPGGPAGPGGAELPSRLDLTGVESLDGGAAAVLLELARGAHAAGRKLELVGARGPVADVLALYAERLGAAEAPVVPRRSGLLEQVGQWALELGGNVRGALEFLGECAHGAMGAARRPSTVPWRAVARLMERTGADGLPIVATIALLVGLITAFQAATQLRQLGAEVYTADLVALSVCRELGPLMTAIVVAGRSGAAFAAELGTMKVSEEVDALRTLGLDPVRFLVFPRILALLAMVPLLTLLADAVGVFGGLLVALAELEVSAAGYLASTRAALDGWDVFGGLVKAAVFGLVVALIGCERGLAARGGAEGVGRSTTSAVVTILFHLVLVDALFSVLYNNFGV